MALHYRCLLIKFLHSLVGVILMRLDLLRLAFQDGQVLGEAVHFSTQTWLHLGESNSIKSMQEVNESFLIISKSEILLRALVGVFALASSFSSLLVSSTFKFAKKNFDFAN